MAIKSREKQKNGSTEKELEVTIDNGDLKLIDSLVDAYSFKDRNALLKFAVGALLQGNNDDGLYTIKSDSENPKAKLLSRVKPSDDLLTTKPE